MLDPTYVKEEIENNLEWNLAFVLSEMLNDSAPLGWSRYIWIAKALMKKFEIKENGLLQK